MQRAYALFFSALATNDLATEVLACPVNAPYLFEVLDTLVGVATGCSDAAVVRTALVCLGTLTRSWLSPSPTSPLPPSLVPRFLNFVVEEVGARAVWGICVGPAWDPRDAQGKVLVVEAVGLQACIALSVAASTGGPLPSIPLSQFSPPDALACFAGPPALTQRGVPPHVAAGFTDRLRSCLDKPGEAVEAFLEVARAVRSAAGLPP